MNLTLTLSYILLACWFGFVGAAVAAKSMEITTIIKPVKLDPLGYKPLPQWV